MSPCPFERSGRNILDEQHDVLRGWRIRARKIGREIARSGIQDEDIIPLLLGLRRVTFFTSDSDFYVRSLCHTRYCLIVLNVADDETAVFIRRFLRHPAFDSEAKRMGAVVRAGYGSISMWRLRAETEERLPCQP